MAGRDGRDGPWRDPAVPRSPLGVRTPATYALTARGGIRYVPVTRSGVVIGYLWMAAAEGAAGYVRRLDAPPETFRSPLVWSDRLEEAFARHVPPGEVARRWAGAPEDPVGGVIAAGATERSAESLAALYRIADPGAAPPPESLDPDLPDGFVDRSKDWGDLSPFTLDRPGYDTDTGTVVRYLPVTRGGTVLGYLWASPTEEAADYLPRPVAGADGFAAGALWLARLEESKREGLPALAALRRWIGAPEDPQLGGIAVGAREREAPTLQVLRDIADR